MDICIVYFLKHIFVKKMCFFCVQNQVFGILCKHLKKNRNTY